MLPPDDAEKAADELPMSCQLPKDAVPPNGFEASGETLANSLPNMLPPDDAEKAVDELPKDATANGFEGSCETLATMDLGLMGADAGEH